MHSIGSISNFLHIMLFPSNFSCWKNSGISFTSTESIWFGTTSLVKSNQNLDICVRIAPLSVILFFKILSNAEIRSVATIIRLSPLSYTSLTFPSLNGLNSCMFSCPPSYAFEFYFSVESKSNYFSDQLRKL